MSDFQESADSRTTAAPLPREGAPVLEWCEIHQRRHMAPGHGDPEPAPGAYLTINYPPRLPRMAFLDPECGRELLVITIRGGKVCASYDDDDLDDAARLLVERAIALGELPDVPPATIGSVLRGHGFTVVPLADGSLHATPE